MNIKKAISGFVLIILSTNISLSQTGNILDVDYSISNSVLSSDGIAILDNDGFNQYVQVGLHGIKRPGTSGINCIVQFFFESPIGITYPLSDEIRITDLDFNNSNESKLKQLYLIFRAGLKEGKILLKYYEIRIDGSRTTTITSPKIYLAKIGSTPPNILMPGAWSNKSQGRFVFISETNLSTFRIIRPSNDHFINSHTNAKILSSGGKISMVMQLDGNLVISEVASGKALWASNSVDQDRRQGDRYAAIFQLDGNIVIYKADVNGRFSIPKWSANTLTLGNSLGHNAKYGFLALQDDGNFVLYFPKYYDANNYNVIVKTDSGGKLSPHFGQMK